MANYIRRGYPKEEILAALKKAKELNRDTLLEEKKITPRKQRKRLLPLIVTYNPANPNFNKIIKKNIGIW